jgi:hypothetical protein
MAVCIHCGSPADTVEHPLPAAFGGFRNAPTLDDRLCKPCNNTRLGILDEHFARCGPEGFLRKYYGIDGRSTHAPINPFYRGSAGGQRIEMKAFDAQLGCEVLMECSDGQFKQVRQLIVTDDQGNAHQLPIREGTTPEQLRTAYKDLNVQAQEIRVLCDDDERDWVEPLIASAGGGTMTWNREEGSATYNGARTSFVMTNRYFRAIAKIGFPYFLTQFREYLGSESIFDDIRAFILDETSTVDRANQYVGKRQLPLLKEMLTSGARPAGWQAHLLAGEVKDARLIAHVQMFISEDWPAPAYTIILGTNSLLLDRAAGHLYAYYQDGPQGTYAGEAHTLDTMKTNRSVPLLPVIMPA